MNRLRYLLRDYQIFRLMRYGRFRSAYQAIQCAIRDALTFH